MIALIGLWAHALAATLYGALTAWQLRHWRAGRAAWPLALAFAAMTAWAVFQAVLGPGTMFSGIAEALRNAAFLGFMYSLTHGARDERQHAVRVVYGAVAGAVGLQAVLAILAPQVVDQAALAAGLASARSSIGLTVAAGSLVLVHNLYGQAAPNSRAGIQLPVIALAAIWAYDLHFYTVAYLTGEAYNELFAMRGAVAAIVAPLFALAARRQDAWRVQLSRAATFQSLSVLAILGYFIVMMAATKAMAAVDSDWMRLAQAGFIIAMTALALSLIPSGKARAWLRVIVSKHFFEHRYDYREDWLRFTRAVGKSGSDGAPLGERVLKALAEMAGSSGGLLLVADESNRLAPGARWNWRHGETHGGTISPELTSLIEATSYVIDFAALDEGMLTCREQSAAVPGWLGHEGAAWAGIPLVHDGRLVALALLDHPAPRRALDWEDYDLFRTAGIQAASYLAEARSQDALADAQRFDEFNRRFAFIMHDIKNLVSQLSLVARNAERHADNPEFRADMIATLQSSVAKMNDLLARLSRGNKGEAQPPRAMPLKPILAAIVETKRHAHPVELTAHPDLTAMADPARLEQAVGHLVQNAIDASPVGAPVRLIAAARGPEATIEVVDSGAGMSPDFVRTRLFQPFASTKDGGFGVGAFEARTLISGMGGRIEVESREGGGTRFTIFLPLGAADAAAAPLRMRA